MNIIKTLFISTFVLSMSCLHAAAAVNTDPSSSPLPSKGTTPPTYNAVEASRVNKPATAQSSDRTIEEKIQSALKKNKTLSEGAKNVNIVAANGIVSITGKVVSEAEKAQIEKIAKEVNGVKSVGLSLTLLPKEPALPAEKIAAVKPQPVSDEEIQKHVQWDLKHNFSLSPEAKNLTVTVNEGKVTLSGNVVSEIEKSKVESVAKIAPGAKEINNNTLIKK